MIVGLDALGARVVPGSSSSKRGGGIVDPRSKTDVSKRDARQKGAEKVWQSKTSGMSAKQVAANARATGARAVNAGNALASRAFQPMRGRGVRRGAKAQRAQRSIDRRKKSGGRLADLGNKLIKMSTSIQGDVLVGEDAPDWLAKWLENFIPAVEALTKVMNAVAAAGELAASVGALADQVDAAGKSDLAAAGYDISDRAQDEVDKFDIDKVKRASDIDVTVPGKVDKIRSDAATWQQKAQAALQASGGGGGGGGGGGSGGGGDAGLPGEGGGDAGLEAEAEAGRSQQPEIDWGESQPPPSGTGEPDPFASEAEAALNEDFTEEDLIPNEDVTWPAVAADDVVGLDVLGAVQSFDGRQRWVDRRGRVLRSSSPSETILRPTAISVGRIGVLGVAYGEKNLFNLTSWKYSPIARVQVWGGERNVLDVAPNFTKPQRVDIVFDNGTRLSHKDVTFLDVHGGTTDYVGYMVGVAVEDKIKKAYFAVSVADAARAMEQAYAILEEARKTARGGFFQKNLGVERTISNRMAQISAFTNDLRAQKNQGRAVTQEEWEKTRNYIRVAMSEWSGVNEGRAYQDEVFNQFLDEVKEGFRPGSLLELATGVPKWVWVVGGLALVIGVGGVVLAYVVRSFR